MPVLYRALAALVLTAACLTPHGALAGDDSAITAAQLVDRISQARGKYVVVNFWASWCRPCRQEIPELINLRREIPEDRMLLIGISMDQSPGDYFRFVKQMPFNYPVFLGDASVAGLFSVSAIPRMVVFGPDGEMIHSSEGYMPADELRELVSRTREGGV